MNDYLDDRILSINSSLNIPLDELRFRFARASGPGGQNVNRTSSRVELLFDVNASPSLSDEQRALILQRLPQYIDGQGLLRLISSETPSQWRNRQEVIARFCALLAQSLRVQRRRVATHPSRAARERRLALKRALSQRKAGRGRISPYSSDDE